MMRIFSSAVIAVLATFFMVGCSDQPDPAPVDTVLGYPTAPTGYSNDWGANDQVNPSLVGGQGGDGLAPRNLGSGSGNAFGGGMGGARGNAMNSVFFGFDQYSIRPSERAKVEQVAQYLRNNPSASVILEGHTDSIGTTEYNLGLSDRRANSVKSYLEQMGISGNRLQVLPMGMLNATPGVTRNSPQAEHDRRVDIFPNAN